MSGQLKKKNHRRVDEKPNLSNWNQNLKIRMSYVELHKQEEIPSIAFK